MRSRHPGALFPLLLVGVLAALTFWLQRIAEPAGADRSGKQRHDPDFIVDNFSVRRFDATGNPQHTLVSSRMVHFPDDDSTLVTSPNVSFHRNPPSTLTARRAWVSKDASEVILDGDVRMVRAGVGGPDTVVETSLLKVYPDDETARSDQPVTITQGRSVVSGSGLAADNKTQTITLLGPVRGTIYRTSDKTTP